MLVPAILYRDQIQKEFQTYYYTTDSQLSFDSRLSRKERNEENIMLNSDLYILSWLLQ